MEKTTTYTLCSDATISRATGCPFIRFPGQASWRCRSVMSEAMDSLPCLGRAGEPAPSPTSLLFIYFFFSAVLTWADPCSWTHRANYLCSVDDQFCLPYSPQTLLGYAVSRYSGQPFSLGGAERYSQQWAWAMTKIPYLTWGRIDSRAGKMFCLKTQIRKTYILPSSLIRLYHQVGSADDQSHWLGLLTTHFEVCYLKVILIFYSDWQKLIRPRLLRFFKNKKSHFVFAILDCKSMKENKTVWRDIGRETLSQKSECLFPSLIFFPFLLHILQLPQMYSPVAGSVFFGS